MAKLTIFLCLALFGVCTSASPQGLAVGAPSPASRATLDELQPKLAAALKEWAQSHSDFDVELKSIHSGTSQPVAGTIYNLIIEDTSSSEWSANVVQKLDGTFKEITLTRPGKTHSLSWE